MNHSGQLKRQFWFIIKNLGYGGSRQAGNVRDASVFASRAAAEGQTFDLPRRRHQSNVTTLRQETVQDYHGPACVTSTADSSRSAALQRLRSPHHPATGGRLTRWRKDRVTVRESRSDEIKQLHVGRGEGTSVRFHAEDTVQSSEPGLALDGHKSGSRFYQGPERKERSSADGSVPTTSAPKSGGHGSVSPRAVSAVRIPKFRRAFTASLITTRRRAKAVQIHHERHRRYSNSETDNWRSILTMLEDATPRGLASFEKRLDTVTLKEGVVAVFDTDSREAILEIMQKTGSHLQVLPAAGQPGLAFESLKLFGTSEQNDHAFKILPKYVRPRAQDDLNASRNLSDYLLRSKTFPDQKRTTYNQEALALTPYTFAEEPRDRSGVKMVDGFHENVHKPDSKTVQTIDEADVLRTPAVPIRAVWTHRSKLSGLGASSNRTIALTQTIEELIGQHPRLVRRKTHGLQSPKATNGANEKTVKHLLSLLTAPLATPIISSDALEMALRFMLRHEKHEEIRTAIESLDKTGFSFTGPAYDTLLTAAVRQGSVPNFRFALLLMLRKKVEPTPRTWALLFALVCQRYYAGKTSYRVISALRKRMQNRGVTKHHETALEISEYAMLMDIERFLNSDTKQPVATFIEQKDASAGTLEWLTPSSLKRILHALLSRGLLDEAMSVFGVYRSRGGQLRSDVLNVFLSSAARDGNPSVALHALTQFQGQTRNDSACLNEQSYSLLLKVFWNGQYFNAFRVAWRYACMAGHVSYAFQRRVERSLISWAPAAESCSRKELWAAWSGKFCVGLSQGLSQVAPSVVPGAEAPTQPGYMNNVAQLPRDPPSASDLSGQLEDIVTLACEPPPAPSERVNGYHSARRRRLHGMLRADFDEVTSLTPRLPFVALLEEAWLKDLRWKERGLGIPKGLRKGERYSGRAFVEMMRHRIRVPVVVGDGTKASSFAVNLWAPAGKIEAPEPQTDLQST